MMQPTVTLRRQEHRQQQVLSIYAPNIPELNAILRQLGCTFSTSKKMWWLPWNRATVNTVYTAFKGKAWVDYTALKAEAKAAPAPKSPVQNTPKKQNTTADVVWTDTQKKAMWAYADKLKVRRYSESTFKTYGVYFKQFLAAHPDSARRILPLAPTIRTSNETTIQIE